jgi:subtilisin family serine protease
MSIALRRCAVAALCGICLAAPLSAQAPKTDPYWTSSGSWGQKQRDQWGLERIGWSPALAREAKAPVIVAVIDTGLDYYHKDLASQRVFFNAREILNGRDDDGNGYIDDVLGWNFVDGNGNPWDHAGHGTHVAGIIAAQTGNGEGIAGMHPGVRILPIKVLNFIGQGRSSRVAEAIYYAVGMGARVINLSLGGELSQAALRAIDYAAGKGAVVVVAAGNDGKEISKNRAAGLPNVITVGATDEKDQRASFSSFGEAIDVAAPGVDILSLRARRTDVALVAGLAGYQGGSNFVGPQARYYRASGTSFAAPFVSGAAALILSQNPELDPAAIKRMIVHSARDIGVPGVDPDTGFGLLDLKAALAADPRFFLDAGIAEISVQRKDDQVFVRVTGTADADSYGSAWIELGQGEAPSQWKRISRSLDKPVRAGVLDDLPASHFAASPVWMLRLIVRHANGKQRETRHVLRLS